MTSSVFGGIIVFSTCCAGVGGEGEGGRLVDEFLDCVLHKLVEGGYLCLHEGLQG